jgi:hypothetical protein
MNTYKLFADWDTSKGYRIIGHYTEEIGDFRFSKFAATSSTAESITHIIRFYNYPQKDEISEFIHTDSKVHLVKTNEDRFALALELGMPSDAFLTDEEISNIMRSRYY